MSLCIKEIRDGVGYLIFNNPEKANALSYHMLKEATSILKELEEHRHVKIIAITGNGKNFCGGADITEMYQSLDPSYTPSIHDQLTILKNFLDGIYNSSKLTISIVKGAAMGGGCGIALIPDIIIAEKNSRFGFPEVTIGFIPALVSVPLLRKFPHHTIKRLMLTGERITAEEAYRLNLIDILYEKIEDIQEVHEKLVEISRRVNGDAIFRTKNLWRILEPMNINLQLDYALLANYSCRVQSPYFKKALMNIIEKKPLPPWQPDE